MSGCQAWGESEVYSRSRFQRAELLVGKAGSLSSSKPAQPGFNSKSSNCSPFFSSALLRHWHGDGARRPKETFFCGPGPKGSLCEQDSRDSWQVRSRM